MAEIDRVGMRGGPQRIFKDGKEVHKTPNPDVAARAQTLIQHRSRVYRRRFGNRETIPAAKLNPYLNQ